MLARSVPERALGALLGGEQAADVLYQHLAELAKSVAASISVAESSTETTVKEAAPPSPAPKAAIPALPALKLGPLRDALRSAIQTDIDQRTGHGHRLNESHLAASNLCDQPFLEIPDIPAFDDIIDAVLVSEGSDLHFREVHVQRYAEVLLELDPTVLVAWHLVKRTATKGQGKQSTLHKSVAGLTTLFVGPRFFSLPFAENHAHLGGIVGDELVLAQLVLGHQWPSTSDEQLPHVNRLRRIRRLLVALVGMWGADDAVDPLVPVERMVDLLRACRDDAELAAPNPTIDWDFMERGIVIEGEEEIEAEHWDATIANEDKQLVTSQWLLRRLAAAVRKHDLQRAWIWLFILLLRTYRAKKARQPAACAIVLLVIAEIMVLRRQLLMDGSGLRRFTTGVFHSPLRNEATSHARWPETSMRETARRLFASPGDKAELKISAASLATCNAAVAFARAADARIQTFGGTGALHAAPASAGHAHSRSHWHFCAHFNRVADSSRSKLWKQAVALHDVLHSAAPWDLAPPFDGGSGHLVLPAKLIRGLDVVGDETRWSIERFAPMLRWLRDPAATYDPLSESAGLQAPVSKLHLSIHAGEDYAHPLSGLRHVNETVRFCKMQAGDRLGHALALGIPPDEWLHRHGEVLLSVDEHVDNLIWAWREAVKLDRLKEAQRVRPRLEARIARMLPCVSWYPWNDGMPAPTWADLMRLYQAWKLRRNCAHKALEQGSDTEVGGPELSAGVPDLSRLREQCKAPSMNTAEGLYVLRARLEAASSTAAKKPMRQVRVTVQRHGHVTRGQQRLESLDAEAAKYLHDHDDAHDLRFMLALQDACIERYVRLGLSIETNPSSNVYIGQLQHHSDHPIYRWNPPNSVDLADGGRFNQFNLRKRPMPVTINTDDPGMIPTTLRMEHHLMHEAAIDRGHAEQMADDWIEQLRQHGMKRFDDVH
jgi:hypothetical protein